MTTPPEQPAQPPSGEPPATPVPPEPPAEPAPPAAPAPPAETAAPPAEPAAPAAPPQATAPAAAAAATPIVSWDAPPTQPGPAAGVEFAPHGQRLVAYIVDGLILTVVILLATALMAVILVVAGGVTTSGPLTWGDLTPVVVVTLTVYLVVVFVISLAYFPWFWSRTGQTPGMRMFDLYVVRDQDGSKISGGTALLRLIGLWVAFAVLYIGIIWIFIDSRRRGWQDLIAGTVVVKRSSPAR